MPRSWEQTDFNTSMIHFSFPKLSPIPWDEGHGIYNFLLPSPTDGIYQIWRCRFWEDDANVRRTMTDAILEQ